MAAHDTNKEIVHYEDGLPVFNVRRINEIEQEQEKAKERDLKYRDEQLRINKWMMRFTGLLVFAAFVGGIIGGYQAHVASLNAAAALENAKAAKDQAQAARDMVAQMRQSSTDTHDLAVQATKQANAAKDAADAAKQALTFSNKSLHISQRPYVTIEDGRFDPPLEQSHDPANVSLRFRNSGRSPALDVITNSIRASIDGQEAPELPPSDNAESIIPSDGNMMTSFLLWLRKPGDFDGIIAGTKRLSFRGTLTYVDIFKGRHKTTFCAVYDAKRKIFKFCPGNEVE